MIKIPSSRQRKTKPTIVLDIGSEAIKALVFRKEGGRVILLGRSLDYLDPFRVWEPHLETGGQNGMAFEIKMIQEFAGKVVQEALKMSGQKDADVVAALPPTIFRAFLKTVVLNRSESREIISGREEKDIFVQAQKKAKELALDETSENYGSGSKFFVAPKIVSITIDGYKVPSLRGFRGKDISITYLISALPSAYLDKSGIPIFLKKIKRRRFKGFFHEALYFAHPEFSYQDGIFIDLGGGTTEIFVVRDKELFFAGQVTLGGADFTKLIAEDFGVDLTRARELKENYAGGRLSGEVASRLKEKFRPIIDRWVAGVFRCLREAPGSLPSSFYLFGGAALLPDFKEAVGQGLFGAPLAGDPKVNFLTPKDLTGIENQEILSASPQETPPLLLTYLCS